MMTSVQYGKAPMRFGKYLLLDRIAAGGMAELFLAKQTGLKGFEKVVAIKRILPLLTQDPEFVGMFINEAKLAALLSHQNIVQIFDLGTTEGFYYIAMEYVMGKDLRTVMQRSQARSLPLPVGHALLIASRICNGLDYAHRKRDLHGRELHLVHRDVSPQNMLLSYEGEIKLVDFGIAKAATQTNETRTGTLKGKLAYMSPEQATGKALDHRSDIFSLGIVLHELVTGRRLFTGNNEFALLEQVRQADIAPPSQLNPELSPDIDALIMKALAKDPADRFPYASDMEIAIEQLIVAKGYAFSSLSMANYMHALFEPDIAEDTARLQRVASIAAAPPAEQPTIVRPAHAAASSGHATAYDPLRPSTLPKPVRLPVTKRFLGAVAALCWLGLLAALWRPELVPWRQLQQAYHTLNQRTDQLVARLTAVEETRFITPSPAQGPPATVLADAGVTGALDEPAWRPPDSAPPLRPGPERRQELQRLYEEARRAYQAGDLAGAESNLRTALSINPQAAHGYHLLAMVLHEQKKIEAAIVVLTDGLHRFPGNATLHHDLGRLYAEKNISSLAVEELQLALSLAPSAPWADEAAALIKSFRAAPAVPASTPGPDGPKE
ncbi:MAG: protein kinase [Nitrospirota bacterium]